MLREVRSAEDANFRRGNQRGGRTVDQSLEVGLADDGGGASECGSVVGMIVGSGSLSSTVTWGTSMVVVTDGLGGSREPRLLAVVAVDIIEAWP